MPVKVEQEVLDGIEAVRDSGVTNMLDRTTVARLCAEWGFDAAAIWVTEHRKEYAEGIFQGFEAAEDDEAPEKEGEN